MRKILNFGSLNIDNVYKVAHFVRPGETLSSLEYAKFAGGKGNNQSIALARAGAKVFHAGKIGEDGLFLKKQLAAAGVDVSLLQTVDTPTGHAIIQVDKDGENCIILFGGANQKISAADAKKTLAGFGEGDFLLLQNEISSMPEIIKTAAKRKIKIVFNPAPMTEEVKKYPLEHVSLFILNEIEGTELTGAKKEQEILKKIVRMYPKSSTILTLGARGAIYSGPEGVIMAPGRRVKAVDTTAAGDTFIGYFLANFATGSNLGRSLETACAAAAICVTRKGAADSIPKKSEVRIGG